MTETEVLNKLLDILINYSKEYYIKKFDPFYMKDKQTIDINEYGIQ